MKPSVKGQPGVRQKLSGETKLQRPQAKKMKAFSGSATTVGPQMTFQAGKKK